MFSFCVEQVSRMEYNPEGDHCECRKSKDDLTGHGKHHREHKESTSSRTKKVSSPAALWASPEHSHGSDKSHFFGRTKKVSAPPTAQFEALLSAASHLREVERERKKSAHEPRSTQHHHEHHHHHHLFQQRHQTHHHPNPGSYLQRHLAHHKGEGDHHNGPYQSLPDVEEAPTPPQRKAHGARKERKKGSVMVPPTLEQLQAAVLEEAAKHGRKNTGPVHPLNIFGRTKKVSAPPVAQFDALMAANARNTGEQERKRSAHTPGTNQGAHHHHNNQQHPHQGQLLHHSPQRLENIHLHLHEPLLSQRKCMNGASGHKKKQLQQPGEDLDHRLDGLWISQCEGEVVRPRTPAERMAHELDSALAAVAKRRKEKAAAESGRKSPMTPAEALGAEMDSALAAALIRREKKLTSGDGQWGGARGVTGHTILHRSTEMLSRG
ncbi:bromodomain-containing protein 4B-like [Ischnura elegans]|uniref:bromodomain-containing protein 4B-like n=1 Tax=Ischnura elegans TaxID=197161 RepID=UPI001ED87262|nr:bromodomain-containing protein 4B-like [Ischnura elegans]